MNELKIVNKKIAELIPYENNPRKNESAVDAVAESISAFGFKVPVIVDSDDVIVAGHTRVKAAEKLGLDSVPCIIADDLTEEQIKAFRLADNKTAELAEWDFDKLSAELDELIAEGIDMSAFGFEDEDWFKTRRKEGAERQEGNDEYNEFLEKFEPKKTTDDCYTPDEVYDAVAEWVEKEYNLSRKNFRRPFYPGGDYKAEKYKKTDVVVDNPPFSILAEILSYYNENGIKFFLFAPSLVIFSSSSSCAVLTGVQIVYENGAVVDTSFLTNLEDDRFRTAPTLYEKVNEAVKKIKKEKTAELPKYEYPLNVVTSAKIKLLSKYGIDYRVSKAESYKIDALDSQLEKGKQIYGDGYLISDEAAAEKAAAEKAAAEKWELSNREKEIIKSLSRKKAGTNGEI